MRRATLAAMVIGLAAVIGGAAEAQAQVYFGNGNFGIRIGPSRGYGSGYGYGSGWGRGYGYGPGVGGVYGNYMVPGYPYYGTGRPSYYYGGGNYNSYVAPQRTIVVTPSQPRQSPSTRPRPIPRSLPRSWRSPSPAAPALRERRAFPGSRG